jgi:hypothetical protein
MRCNLSAMKAVTETTTTTEVRADGPDPRTWRDSEAFKKAEALRPWLQWLLIAVMAIGSLYMYNRDANAEQSVSLHDLEARQSRTETIIATKTAERDRQMSELKSAMVTTQLFDERTENIQRQLTEIRTDQKEILNRLPVRLP